MNNQRTLKILAILLVLGILAASSSLGYFFGYARGQNSEIANWRGGDWGKLNHVLYTVEQYFLQDIDRESLLEGALHGLINSLDDPYSSYLSPEEMEEMMIQSGGAYSGIGVEVTMENNRVTIIAPFAGSPAEEAGLLPGDQIVEVDGKNIEGQGLNDAVKDIRGKEGTEVNLGIVREGLSSIFRVTLVRAKIERSSVTWETLPSGIGYIALSQFSDDSDKEFKAALRDLKGNMQGLVLDLRDNPGGYLDVVVEIAKEIVPRGIIVYTEDKEGNRTSEAVSTLKDRGFPMVVLVNGNSASASEILAGALQDNDVPVVGSNSYGKGTVQRFYSLDDDSYVKLTMAKFFTPKGKEIQGNGVTPNYPVEMDPVTRLSQLRYTGTLELGSQALHVFQLQSMLAALDYLDTTPTGVYDQATADAVAELQKDSGLEISGNLDLATTEALNQLWEAYARDADTQLSKAVEVLRQLMGS